MGVYIFLLKKEKEEEVFVDTGKGHFDHFEDEASLNERMKELVALKEKVGSIFRVGEVLEIKDSKFKIRSIGKREMRLRLMEK